MGDTKALKASWREAPLPRGNVADASPESVAVVLRNARLLQGYGLREVERALNIRSGHLEALEERRFRDLPPLVYAKGFVAAYALFLNLDKDELVARFCAEAQNSAAPLMSNPTFTKAYTGDSADSHDRRTPSVIAVVAGLIIAALAYGVWQSSPPTMRDNVALMPHLAQSETVAAPKVIAPVLPTPIVSSEPAAVAVMPVSGVDAPVVAAVDPVRSVAPMPAFETPVSMMAPALPVVVEPRPPYRGAGVVVIRALGETWVQLKGNNGLRVASQVLKAGQSYMIRPNTAATLVTGSLNNISILLDGQPIMVPNAIDLSRVELKLNANDLLNGTALID